MGLPSTQKQMQRLDFALLDHRDVSPFGDGRLAGNAERPRNELDFVIGLGRLGKLE